MHISNDEDSNNVFNFLKDKGDVRNDIKTENKIENDYSAFSDKEEIDQSK